MIKTPIKKKAGGIIKGERKPKTIKMLNLDPKFNNLPTDMKQNIMSYLANPVGRPKATPIMIKDAAEKNKMRMRLTAQSKKALNEGDFDNYINIVEKMKSSGLIGKKAYDNRVDDWISNMNKMIEQQPEFNEEEFVEQVEPTTTAAIEKMRARLVDAVKEPDEDNEAIEKMRARLVDAVKVKEPAPVKRSSSIYSLSGDKEPGEYFLAEDDESIKYIGNEKAEDVNMKKATTKMFAMEREAALKKRSQLADHFSTYDKSSSSIGVVPGKPMIDKPMDKLMYKQVSKKEKSEIRKILFSDKFDYGDDELEFVWNNTMDENMKDSVLMGNESSLEKVKNLIISAKQTQQYVPDYLEDLGGMTTEERQIAFHTELINMRMTAIEKRQKEAKPINNFENNAAAGGGINQGKSIGKLEKDEQFKQPDIFENYEEVLDSKLTDDAYVRELFKGINPNTTSVLGQTDGDDADFFSVLNDINNLQDNAEINEALENIEILSGGNKDTLFGEQDLLSTRRNNPASQGYFQNDAPFMQDDNPAPLARGRQAQASEEIDPALLDRQEREDTATTIGLGIGILANAYRTTFSRSDIPDSRAGGEQDILGSINQSLRLLGKRGLYGDDKSLGKGDDMYEGVSISSRLNNVMAFGAAKNPNYLLTEEKPDPSQLSAAMGMNQGTAQGSTLPQLRQQEFSYKQANRKTAHDGYSFMRGGNATAQKIIGEFDP